MIRTACFLILGLTFCSCSKSTAPTSDTTDCQLTPNTDNKISFIVNAFGKKDSLVDFFKDPLIDFSIRANAVGGPPIEPLDTAIRGSEISYVDSSFFLEMRTGYSVTSGVKIGEKGYNVSLSVIVPKMVSGQSSWGEITNAGKSGVSFTLTNYPSQLYQYRPVSGKTLISFSKTTVAGYPDSIFGSFCGTMKNDNGDRWEVKDGKFCFIIP